MGVNRERNNSEEAIELVFEAAAQQYANTLPNDTIEFNYYGTKPGEKESPGYVLPENSRTEIANPRSIGNKEKGEESRKRN
jgi:hypothetical protein